MTLLCAVGGAAGRAGGRAAPAACHKEKEGLSGCLCPLGPRATRNRGTQMEVCTGAGELACVLARQAAC